METKLKPQLFLDCDGVLADFDKKAREVVGMEPREFENLSGAGRFWNKLYGIDDFFYVLDPMPDAHALVEATRHLNPIILTGKPHLRGGDWAVDQKLRWRDKHFPFLDMIVCESKDKIKHAQPGDVIVDDWLKWRQLWVDGGGIWITHTSANNSIMELQQIGIIP